TPGAGALTGVPTGAPMSMPPWYSSSGDQGERRRPNSELIGTRIGHRDGSVAMTALARDRNASSARSASPSRLTRLVSLVSSSSASAGGAAAAAIFAVPPPLPALGPPGLSARAHGAQVPARV